MPAREGYEQNDGQAQVGAHSLLSMIGQSKHLTAGWTGFAIKTLTVSASAGTVFGLSGFMLLHGPLGPALSFLVGSSVGFCGGLVTRWRTDVAEALLVTERFPRLIEHHVRIGESGLELEGRDFADWTSNLRQSPRKQGIIISAMYSATPALNQIRAKQEEALVAEYTAAAAAGSAL